HVAERGDPIPERRVHMPSAPPVAVWESSLRPVAGDASGWAWQSPDGTPRPSGDLAAMLAERFVAQVRTTAPTSLA
ncbi:MAG: hypothetical protein MUF53_06420, partial [Gemmatimonadaceae bacterium]|nr:hypothetical protein [Gemmatimonadaceae bacterium]